MDQNIIIAAAAGFFIGAVLVWIIKNTNQSNAEHLQEESDDLRKEHEALKKAFADYRSDVNSHFIKTADAVEQLADGYKNVYRQLSTGAHALMDQETLQKQLSKRQNKTITLGFAANALPRPRAKRRQNPQKPLPQKPRQRHHRKKPQPPARQRRGKTKHRMRRLNVTCKTTRGKHHEKTSQHTDPYRRRPARRLPKRRRRRATSR